MASYAVAASFGGLAAPRRLPLAAHRVAGVAHQQIVRAARAWITLARYGARRGSALASVTHPLTQHLKGDIPTWQDEGTF